MNVGYCVIEIGIGRFYLIKETLICENYNRKCLFLRVLRFGLIIFVKFFIC